MKQLLSIGLLIAALVLTSFTHTAVAKTKVQSAKDLAEHVSRRQKIPVYGGLSPLLARTIAGGIALVSLLSCRQFFRTGLPCHHTILTILNMPVFSTFLEGELVSFQIGHINASDLPQREEP